MLQSVKNTTCTNFKMTEKKMRSPQKEKVEEKEKTHL